jgi:hypothetical protein
MCPFSADIPLAAADELRESVRVVESLVEPKDTLAVRKEEKQTSTSPDHH